MNEARDKSGKPMRLHTIVTICEAAEGVSARRFAYEFMMRENRQPSTAMEEEMMNLRLRPTGRDDAWPATHWGCVREAWTDERDEQAASHLAEWAILPSFRMIEGELDAVLQSLGLEVVS